MSFILWVDSIVNEALRAALTARNIFFLFGGCGWFDLALFFFKAKCFLLKIVGSLFAGVGLLFIIFKIRGSIEAFKSVNSATAAGMDKAVGTL